jgi:hypothetical protein
VTVRIGGMYALKRIAEDSPDRDHLAVMDVLTHFIRHPPYASEQVEIMRSTDPDYLVDQEWINCPDVVAAIEIISTKNPHQEYVEDEQNYDLTLSHANLSCLRLVDVELQYQHLTGADLRGANLTSSSLEGIYLTECKLALANLTDAELTDAKLMRANLTGANLTAADLTGADLAGADLTGAVLTDTNLERANIENANLTNANLTDANLIDVKNISQSQLDSARVAVDGNPPSLPDGLNPPGNSSPVE